MSNKKCPLILRLGWTGIPEYDFIIAYGLEKVKKLMYDIYYGKNS